MKSSYKKDAVSGVKWTSFSSLIIAVGSFLLIIILTKLLDKKDFGLFALVNVVIGFSSEFVDIGISQAIIQKSKVTNHQLSTLYWLNILLSVVVSLIIFFGSGLIAHFFETPELKLLLQLVSVSFLFSGISVQYQALFQKNMMFKLMSVIDISSFIVYVVAVFVLVYFGFGVMSLILGTIARTVVKAIWSVIKGIQFHRPSFYFKWKQVKPFLHFGSFRTGAFLIAFLNTQLDSILIGKLIGVSELGIYDVFKRIAVQPVRFLSPIIQKVTYPLLAKVHEDKKRITGMFLKILAFLNMTRFPIFIGIALCAQSLSKVFLDVEWVGEFQLLQILCLVYLFDSVQSFIGQGMIASGKANWALYSNTIMLPINILTLYIGSFWGVQGIAIALLLKSLVIIIPRYYFIVRHLYLIGLKKYLELIFKDFVVVLGIAFFIDFMAHFVEMNALVDIGMRMVLFGILIAGFYYFFAKEQVNYLKSLVRNDE